MMNLGFNNRWVRLVKDLLFVAVAVWLITKSNFFAVALGILALWWYGRDAWFQAKALWQEKHYVPRGQAPEQGPIKQPGTESDGKITVTNLSDAKEVDYEKDE